jgi:hypothetical protein
MVLRRRGRLRAGNEELPGQHGFIHRSNLVWQGLHQRGVDSKHRVEQMGKTDAVGSET